METLKLTTIRGFIWKFLQSTGTHVISFMVQLVLARILTPNDYGVVAIVTVFTSVSMVFINVGFSSAIIQKKELSNDDISTLFYVNMILSVMVYLILYIFAPTVSIFYGVPELTKMLRIASLIVIIGGIYSIPQALITRDMEFKKSSIAYFIGAIFQGVVGIYLAIKGFGSWALIYSTLINYIVCCILVCFMKKWKLKFIFSKTTFFETVGFSVKILLIELFNSVFNSVKSLIIGKQYTSADLAYYSKGNQFPTLVMSLIDGSTAAVLFPALSKYQDDWDNGLLALRRSMKVSLFVCAPMMLGIFAVADSLINFLLTEKWLEAVPYVRIGCIICLFWPLAAQRHALNARGNSGVALALNVIGKVITLFFILITYKHSAQMMILSTVFSSFIVMIIEAFVYQKYLNYSIKQQIKDIAPIIMIATVMCAVVYPIQFLKTNNFVTLLIQGIIGVIVYLLLSRICRIDSLYYIMDLVKNMLGKRFNRS